MKCSDSPGILYKFASTDLELKTGLNSAGIISEWSTMDTQLDAEVFTHTGTWLCVTIQTCLIQGAYFLADRSK